MRKAKTLDKALLLYQEGVDGQDFYVTGLGHKWPFVFIFHNNRSHNTFTATQQVLGDTFLVFSLVFLSFVMSKLRYGFISIYLGVQLIELQEESKAFVLFSAGICYQGGGYNGILS